MARGVVGGEPVNMELLRGNGDDNLRIARAIVEDLTGDGVPDYITSETNCTKAANADQHSNCVSTAKLTLTAGKYAGQTLVPSNDSYVLLSETADGKLYWCKEHDKFEIGNLKLLSNLVVKDLDGDGLADISFRLFIGADPKDRAKPDTVQVILFNKSTTNTPKNLAHIHTHP